MSFNQNQTMSEVQQPSMSIKRLLLTDAGTWKDQWHRPWEFSMSGDAGARISDAALAGNGVVSNQLMKTIAPNVLAPSAIAASPVNISNGWSNRRHLFMMELEIIPRRMATPITYYLQGYTEYDGSTRSGLIDPNMRFFINSYLATQRCRIMGAGGMVQEVEQVLENNQITNGSFYNAATGQAMDPILMRPMDLVSVMQTNWMANSVLPRNSNITDARIMLDATDAKVSTRANNLATDYMTRLANGFLQASSDAAGVDARATVLSSTMGSVADGSLNTVSFFSMLRQVRNNPLLPLNHFTMMELMRMDATVPQRTVVLSRSAPIMASTHQTGSNLALPMSSVVDGEQWNNLSVENNVAVALQAGIPHIANSMLLQVVAFTAIYSANNWQVNLTGARHFSKAVLHNQYQMFKNRLISELLFGISLRHNNPGAMIAINGFYDLFGASKFDISIDGRKAVEFFSPSFCDSLIAPIISPTSQQIANVAASVENTLVNVAQAFQQRNPIQF